MHMKCLKLILLLSMVVAMVGSVSAESIDHKEEASLDNFDDEEFPLPENIEPATSLRSVNRFFINHKPRAALTTCNRNPRVCRAKGSPGPDCCNRRCVNIAKDRLNCGKCGHKCKYSEICCNGKCVNPSMNKNHCGGCNKKCKKGSKCVYGMCGYA